jgi:hypothetical protein
MFSLEVRQTQKKLPGCSHIERGFLKVKNCHEVATRIARSQIHDSGGHRISFFPTGGVTELQHGWVLTSFRRRFNTVTKSLHRWHWTTTGRILETLLVLYSPDSYTNTGISLHYLFIDAIEEGLSRIPNDLNPP